MKLLSKDQYDDRRAELTEEKALAEKDYRRACLALEVGSGDEAAVSKARAHVERLAGRIDGLHGAWSESQKIDAQERAAAADDAHAALEADVEGELAHRRKAFAAIQRHAAVLGKAMLEFDETAQALRRLVSRKAGQGGALVFENALKSGPAVSAVLTEVGVNLEMIGATNQGADQHPGREEKFADVMRSNVARLAPEKEQPVEVVVNPNDPPASMYDYSAAAAKGTPSGFDAFQGGE